MSFRHGLFWLNLATKPPCTLHYPCWKLCDWVFPHPWPPPFLGLPAFKLSPRVCGWHLTNRRYMLTSEWGQLAVIDSARNAKMRYVLISGAPLLLSLIRIKCKYILKKNIISYQNTPLLRVWTSELSVYMISDRHGGTKPLPFLDEVCVCTFMFLYAQIS